MNNKAYLSILLLLLCGINNSFCQDSLDQYCTITLASSSEKDNQKEHWPLWSFFYIYVNGEEKLLEEPKESKGKEYYHQTLQKGSKPIALCSMFGDTLVLHTKPLFKDTLIELDTLLFQHYTLATTAILHEPLNIGEELKLLFPYHKTNSYSPIYLLHCKAISRDSIRITINKTKESQMGVVIAMDDWRHFIQEAQKNIHPRKKQEGIFIVEKQKSLQKYFLKQSSLKKLSILLAGS